MVEQDPTTTPKIESGSNPKAEALQAELLLDGFDFGYVADKLADFLSDEDCDFIRGGVDEDGKPLTLNELISRIYGGALVAGNDPEEAMAAADLTDNDPSSESED